MVVRIQLTIKHIRGHTFQIDADVDSDVLGLKVQIWESQKIAIENQRLVFNGRELQDNSKLSAYGIGDNAIIFLVESNSQQPQAQVTIPVAMQPQSQPQPQPQTQVQMSNCNYGDNSVYQYPQQVQGREIYYEQFDNESILSEERIQNVLYLRRWVRNYCILGMIVTVVNIFNCLFFLVPYFMYTLGFIGTRNLNRFLLVFPLLLTTLIGFGLTSTSIYLLIYYYSPFEFLLLLVGILHLIIFIGVCKLMSRIGKLSPQEWWQARLRIRSTGCCARN